MAGTWTQEDEGRVVPSPGPMPMGTDGKRGKGEKLGRTRILARDQAGGVPGFHPLHERVLQILKAQVREVEHRRQAGSLFSERHSMFWEERNTVSAPIYNLKM